MSADLERLRALLEGLGTMSLDLLLDEPPEKFRVYGATIRMACETAEKLIPDAERYEWMAADPGSRACWEFCKDKADMDARIDDAMRHAGDEGREG